MKKLSRLNINPEKVMKNEELITLRGGTVYCCFVYCDGEYVTMIPVQKDTQAEACDEVQGQYPNYLVSCQETY